MQRSDANQFSNSQTKNINELQQDIDSLEILVNNATTPFVRTAAQGTAYSHATTPCCRSPTACARQERLRQPRSDGLPPALKLRDKARIWNQARTLAKSSRNMFSFDESAAKEALNQLYRMQGRVAQENIAPRVDHDLLPDRGSAGRHHPQGRPGTSGRGVDHLLRDLLHHHASRARNWPRRAAGKPYTASGSRRSSSRRSPYT